MTTGNTWWDNRTYRDYYEEVGKHILLSSKDEFELLKRYKTCSSCGKSIPTHIVLESCPKCSKEIPKVLSRIIVCSGCGHKFDKHATPDKCLHCGAPRDIEAKHRIVEANLRFVVKRAKSMTTNPEYLSRLISAGNVGLMVAVDKYNLSRETRFLTYADWWIRKEMLDEIRNANLVHIPTHRQKTVLKEQRLGSYECIHCGLHTDEPEHPEYLSPCKKGKTHDFEYSISDVNAMTTSVSVSGNNTLVIPDDDVELDIIDEDMACRVRSILRHLDLRERDKYIIMGYYNIPAGYRKTDNAKSLFQLAAVSGVTPERVRQLKESILKKFKKELLRGRALP